MTGGPAAGDRPGAPLPGETHVPGACPMDCPDGCSWIVTVAGGAARELRGNPGHPFTRGTLCVKLNRYLGHTAAPDRLLHPLRRTGAKGEGAFERITWDDALGEISGRLAAVIAAHGGEAIWPYQGYGTVGYLQGLRGLAGRRFFNSLGASHHHANVCSSAGNAGVAYHLGTPAGMDPEDLRLAKLVIFWGANTLTTGHHLWRFVREGGARTVVIDPVTTRTARQADEHLAPVPGTDAALALGLLHVVVGAGAHDERFLRRWTLGWPEFRDRIGAFPPDRVARITGLPRERIEELGMAIATSRPTAIRAGQGLQRHAGGGTVFRVLACLPGVTGDWHRPGGGLLYSTTAHFGLDLAALRRDDLLAAPVRTRSMARLGTELLESRDPPVKALVINAANPVASNPDRAKIVAGLSRPDLFTVVIDHFATDTADYADIVLPSTMQPEHMDLHSGYGHLYLVWNEPAVAPPGECLPATEIFRRLAAAMGLAEPCLYDSDLELAGQLLGGGHPSLRGITLAGLRARGWARLNVATPFLPFSRGFATRSGRLEFLSEAARADGLDPLPGYVPAAEVADTGRGERYPLALVSVASHFFMNTVFANAPHLRRRAGAQQLLVHPGDAAALCLTDGGLVRVANDRGAFTARLTVSEHVRPGVAAVSKGYWSKLDGEGAHVNACIRDEAADLGGGAVFADTRVTVTMAGAAPQPAGERAVS
jgi:anaerobic selenocysteine-containing dehydrogenase